MRQTIPIPCKLCIQRLSQDNFFKLFSIFIVACRHTIFISYALLTNNILVSFLLYSLQSLTDRISNHLAAKSLQIFLFVFESSPPNLIHYLIGYWKLTRLPQKPTNLNSINKLRKNDISKLRKTVKNKYLSENQISIHDFLPWQNNWRDFHKLQ